MLIVDDALLLAVLAGTANEDVQGGRRPRRGLVPVMSTLEVGRRLNLLTAEAAAAALVLDAAVVVTTESAILVESCTRLGI